MSKNAQIQDHADITKAPAAIRKLYEVAMESRDEVLAKLRAARAAEAATIEQYIAEAL